MENNSIPALSPCAEKEALGAYAKLDIIAPFVILGVLNVITICGNSLVITAVITSQKLRSVTNMFIVSLAIADLLVGVFVLPYSSTSEILNYWPFGEIWCSIWLAVDVWLCTASIFHLVAISLDRYIAISKPFKYPSLMSPTRGKILLAMVWIISFIICFPPLIGWNEKGEDFVDVIQEDTYSGTVHNTSVSPMTSFMSGGAISYSTYLPTNVTLLSVELKNISTTGEPGCVDLYPTCGLTSDPGYIIYSALGSFWIPMVVMSFFYWRIYRVALKATSALKRGVLTTKAGSDLSSSTGDDGTVTLRVHRGGGSGYTRPPLYDAPNSQGSHHSRHPSNSSMTSNGSVTSSSARRSNPHREKRGSRNKYMYDEINEMDIIMQKTKYPAKVCFRKNPHQEEGSVGGGGGAGSGGGAVIAGNGASRFNYESETPAPHKQLTYLGSNPDSKRVHSSDSKRSHHKRRHSREKRRSREIDVDETSDGLSEQGRHTGLLQRIGKRNLRTHLKKLNREKKAAKTVGIIVGCFIVCWCPFFTVYLLGAFCRDCVPSLLFSVFFWLGYCNSAINPCIYALFSKDFRNAFKKLLCCRYERKRPKKSGFFSLLNSLRIRVSSQGSNSDSE